MRLAVVASHPVQYYAPLFRELARRLDVHVFYAHRMMPEQQARDGFGTAFDWDVDLLSGYPHTFLPNVSARPGTDHFGGCDTPEIGRCLRAGKFDALLVTGWHLKAYLQGVWTAKRLQLPAMVRGDSQLTTPRARLKRLAKEAVYPPALRLFDAALYVGQRSREYYLHYRYPEERLFFSPHCVDAEWFAARASVQAGSALRSRLGISPGASVILFAGKLLAFKRPSDVVGAAAILRRRGRDVHVLIAGSGELAGSLIAHAAQSDVPLHMLGFQNQSEMPATYAAADVLALPSSARETWGLVCNEALACGTPIVVSDAVGCAPDLASGSMAGRTYSVGDLAAMVRAVADVLEAPPSSEAIAAKSNAYGLGAAALGIEAALARLSGRVVRGSSAGVVKA